MNKRKIFIPLAAAVVLGFAGVVSGQMSKDEVENIGLSSDKLQSAAKAGVDNGFLGSYNFILYGRDYIPVPVITEFVPAENEEDYDRNYVTDSMPLAIRQVDRDYKSDSPGISELIEVVESLSANRYSINFEKLYKKYGWIVRSVLSKEDYDKGYSTMVEMLLLTHDDLAAHPDLCPKIEEAMKLHWENTLTDPDIGLPDYYQLFRDDISSDTRRKIETFYRSGNTDYENDFMPIWSYSFWLRRKNEGKSVEAYKTLCAIRDDYAKMK